MDWFPVRGSRMSRFLLVNIHFVLRVPTVKLSYRELTETDDNILQNMKILI